MSTRDPLALLLFVEVAPLTYWLTRASANARPEPV